MEPLPWYRIALPAGGVAALAVLCVVWPNPRLRAMLLGVAALVGYAVLQDQVSARLCPEYFTVMHNPVPGLTDPTLLGVVWGFLGAVAGGAVLGLAAGLTATLGRKPPLAVRDLVRPMLVLVTGVGVATALAGASAYRHAELFGVRLDPAAAAGVPEERHRALFVVATYHLVAYAAAAGGGVLLCVWIARERARRAAAGGGTDANGPGPGARPGTAGGG